MAGSSAGLAESQPAVDRGREEARSSDGAGQGLESYPLPDSPDQAPLRRGMASSAPPDYAPAQDQGAARIGALEIDGGQQPDQARAADGISGDGFPPQALGDRWRPAQEPRSAAGQGSGYGVAAMLRIVDAEWHSRIEQDWYAATVAVDLFAFIYVALFYQVRILAAALNAVRELTEAAPL